MPAIRMIIISPGHNYFGRRRGPAGGHPPQSVGTVNCRAGWGLEGDRFYGYRPDYNGQVTFFMEETVEAARVRFAQPDLSPAAFRRNVITRGLDLPALAHRRFTLGGIEFEGRGEARPCAWMNEAVAPGAEEWLRGRGGLRARICGDGALHVGEIEVRLRGEVQARLSFGSAPPGAAERLR